MTSAVCWLDAEDDFELMASAMASEGWTSIDTPFSLSKATLQGSPSGKDVLNRTVVCPRASDTAAYVCVHHFTMHDTARQRRLCQFITELAAAEMGARPDGQAASNLGGYHGRRDLWDRAGFASCDVRELLGTAVRHAAKAEASALRRPIPTMAEGPEAWFNVLWSGCSNALHTHPGESAASPPARVDRGANGAPGQTAASQVAASLPFSSRALGTALGLAAAWHCCRRPRFPSLTRHGTTMSWTPRPSALLQVSAARVWARLISS